MHTIPNNCELSPNWASRSKDDKTAVLRELASAPPSPYELEQNRITTNKGERMHTRSIELRLLDYKARKRKLEADAGVTETVTKTTKTLWGLEAENVRQLALHGKSMILMYQATGEQRYLDRARVNYDKAKSLLRGGFIRPHGVHLTEAA